MAKKNNPGCRCCGNCTIFADDYDRADSSNLGSSWDERSGEWSISSNAALCNSANGLMITTISNPDATPEGYVEALVNLSTTNDQARVVIGYVNDSNYLFAQVRVTSTDAFLRLGKRESGVTTFLTSEQTLSSGGTNTDMIIAVCYADNNVLSGKLTVDSVTIIYDVATAVSTGQKAGLATGTRTGTIQFKEFSWEYRKSVDRPTCQGCDQPCALCEEGTWPFAMQVEFDGVGDDECTTCDEFFNDTVFMLKPTSSGACQYDVAINACGGDLFRILVSLCSNPVFGYPERLWTFVEQFAGEDGLAHHPTDSCSPFPDGAIYDCSEGFTFNMTDSDDTTFGRHQWCDWDTATVTLTPHVT